MDAEPDVPESQPSQSIPQVQTRALVRRVDHTDWDGLILRIRDLEDVVSAMAVAMADHGMIVRRRPDGVIEILKKPKS
jgi:hypothetical protein